MYTFLLFWTFDLREKKVHGFFLDHWSTKKNYKFLKNIENTPYRRVAQKKYNFAPGAANHTFLTHPIQWGGGGPHFQKFVRQYNAIFIGWFIMLIFFEHFHSTSIIYYICLHAIYKL